MAQTQLKPYSVTRGEPQIDWWEELEWLRTYANTAPHLRSAEEKIRAADLSFLSANWITCACGNQCSIIPRWADGIPKDSELAHLGSTFCNQICNLNIDKATSTLEEIEKRAQILITAQLK